MQKNVVPISGYMDYSTQEFLDRMGELTVLPIDGK